MAYLLKAESYPKISFKSIETNPDKSKEARCTYMYGKLQSSVLCPEIKLKQGSLSQIYLINKKNLFEEF